MATYMNPAGRLPSAATTDSFRNFIIDMVAMLNASGWSKASDTGMLDETTVVYPETVSTIAGSQIWYLDDSFHATQPLYVKFTWGRGSASNRISFSFQVGYATDGSGNLTGWVSDVLTPMVGSNTYDAVSAANPLGLFLASGGEGYAWLLWGRFCWPGNNSTPLFLINREFNSDGTVSDSGNWSILYNTSGSYQPKLYTVIRDTGTILNTQCACFIPFDQKTSVKAFITDGWKHPIKYNDWSTLAGAFTYFTYDIPLDNTFSCNINGAERTYIATGVQRMSSSYEVEHVLAALWE
ncbi:MAG TPA: hypothetical protein PLM10_02080 [Saccharofermentans sp.]|nr:hypothetical protein [Saccharofermentans sp.]